jgi:copper(I)-binding protein
MCALAIACSSRDAAPLSVANVVVPEPLPGTRITAGYLTIENNSDQSIVIERVTSPQFARVEMHQTILEDDVARMVPLAPLIVDRRSSVRFVPGGKHLMLSDWPQDIVTGLQITIEFHYDGGGLLIVATTVSPRDELPE